MRKSLVLIVLLFTAPVYSYTPHSHKDLSALSMKLLKKCKYTTQLDSKELIEYSALEDSKTFRGGILKRLMNWHFYNNISEQSVWLIPELINKTFHQRWAELLGYLEGETNLEVRSKIIGSLIHYVQDITNPSHITPVYHGPGVKDKFDYFPIHNRELLSLLSKQCKRLEIFVSSQSYSTVLHSGVREGFGAMNSKFKYKVKGESKISDFTQAFWRSPKKENDFFGEYGFMGNNFGVSLINHDFFVEQSTYKKFALKQQTSAVVYSAAIIAISEKVKSKKERDE